MRYFQSFIPLLLDIHRKTVEERSEFSLSVTLDRQAISLVEQAQASALVKVKNKHTLQRATPDALLQRVSQRELTIQLTQLLSRIPLGNPADYTALKQAVQQWHPWEVGAAQPVNQIRNALLSLLPAVRQRQQLQVLCREYRDYLAREIQSHLKPDHAAIHAQIHAHQSRVFDVLTAGQGEHRASTIHSPTQATSRWVTEQTKYLPKPSVPLAKAIEKYQAVTELEARLHTSVKTASEQCEDFKQQFKSSKMVIEQDRDSWGTKFLKGVATVLSLGTAKWLGIWHVKGQAVSQKIEETLAAPPEGNPASCRIGEP